MCGNGGLPCADVLECWICWLLAATPMFLPTNCAMYFVSITIECDQTICASIVVYARYQTAMIFVYIYVYIYIYMVSVPTKTHQSYCSLVFRYFTKYMHIHIHIYTYITIFLECVVVVRSVRFGSVFWIVELTSVTRIPKTPGSNPRVFIFVFTCKIMLMLQKSSTSQYPVFFPIFHRVFKTSQVVQDFFHQ